MATDGQPWFGPAGFFQSDPNGFWSDDWWGFDAGAGGGGGATYIPIHRPRRRMWLILPLGALATEMVKFFLTALSRAG